MRHSSLNDRYWNDDAKTWGFMVKICSFSLCCCCRVRIIALLTRSPYSLSILLKMRWSFDWISFLSSSWECNNFSAVFFSGRDCKWSFLPNVVFKYVSMMVLKQEIICIQRNNHCQSQIIGNYSKMVRGYNESKWNRHSNGQRNEHCYSHGHVWEYNCNKTLVVIQTCFC